MNLLARAMDKNRISEAHPAFSSIISQLSPDEAVVIWHLSRKNYGLWQSSEFNAETRLFAARKTEENTFPVDDLLFPGNYFVYTDHLYSLNLGGIWQVGNQETVRDASQKQTGVIINSEARLTEFGKMFAKACSPPNLRANWKPSR